LSNRSKLLVKSPTGQNILVKLLVKPSVKICGDGGRIPEASMVVVELPHPIHYYALFSATVRHTAGYQDIFGSCGPTFLYITRRKSPGSLRRGYVIIGSGLLTNSPWSPLPPIYYYALFSATVRHTADYQDTHKHTLSLSRSLSLSLSLSLSRFLSLSLFLSLSHTHTNTHYFALFSATVQGYLAHKKSSLPKTLQ
jgi:hypothetical protein